MKKFATATLLAGFLSIPALAMAEQCSNCIINWCRTTYPTSGDWDGDGMSDDYEMQLARRFKPTLCFDNFNSDLPYKMPAYYHVPPIHINRALIMVYHQMS